MSDETTSAPPATAPGKIDATLIVILVAVAGAIGMVIWSMNKPNPATGPRNTKFTDPAPEMFTSASGLKYGDWIVGNGPSPRQGQRVTVHYTGWLTNGTEFDGSRGDKPATFGLNQVIRGWTEGLQGMKVGGHRRLVIPPELGYGANAKGKIPPNSTLIFEIELLDIQ